MRTEVLFLSFPLFFLFLSLPLPLSFFLFLFVFFLPLLVKVLLLHHAYFQILSLLKDALMVRDVHYHLVSNDNYHVYALLSIS